MEGTGVGGDDHNGVVQSRFTPFAPQRCDATEELSAVSRRTVPSCRRQGVGMVQDPSLCCLPGFLIWISRCSLLGSLNVALTLLLVRHPVY